MAQENVFLSILIPTWNRTEMVLGLVKSANLEQFDDIEIIVVDNCSDETVFQELKVKLHSFPNVRLCRNHSNIGMVKNWNRCIEYAKGDWMTLMCSDDLFCEEAVGRVYRLLKHLEKPYFITYDPTINKNTVYYPAGNETAKGINLPPASGNIWHKNIVKSIGMFDERFKYSADAEYWYRIAYNFPVIKLKRCIAQYIRHDANYMWDTWRKDDFLEQIALLARTNLRYMYDNRLNEAETERLINDGLRQTLMTILESTIAARDKQDIFFKYISEGWRSSKTINTKFDLVSRLSKALLINVLKQGKIKMLRGFHKCENSQVGINNE